MRKCSLYKSNVRSRNKYKSSKRIDVFYDKNKGLVIAEIELDNENEHIDLPDWIDREISTEKKYFNFNLSKEPFLNW